MTQRDEVPRPLLRQGAVRDADLETFWDKDELAELQQSQQLACSEEFSDEEEQQAGKRPRSIAEEDGPDLGAYFSQFDLAWSEEAAVCRTYANYLTARNRPPTRRKLKF